MADLGDTFTLDLVNSLVLTGVASGMSVDADGKLFHVLRVQGFIGSGDDRRFIDGMDIVLHPEVLAPFIRVVSTMEAPSE